jgi:uncharacterized protein DUF2272/tail lysozyme
MTAPTVAVSRRQRAAATPAGLCDAIATVAKREFRRWRPGGGKPLTETMPQATPLLREYYRVGVGWSVPDANLRSAAWHANNYWSAVFVSYVMRTAGARGFAFASNHQAYIRAARRNKLTGDTRSPFWAYRATEIAPRVGDLVCAVRAGSGATYDNIGDAKARGTHCDIVVDVRPGRIRVIGGNTGTPDRPKDGLTVGDKTLRVLPDGRLDLSGRQSRFFAVVSCSGSRPVITAGRQPTPSGGQPAPAGRPVPYGPPVPARRPPAPAGRRLAPGGRQMLYGPPTPAGGPPAPGGRPAPYGPPAPLPTSSDARAAEVIRLLVQRYHYPVNGAAGLAGNLIAESEVIPQRIEGSKAATPLRATDFAGRERDFTPDEVRDRDSARQVGPKLPGVGLAQWTKKERRAGLFQHTYRGRVLGSAILSDLEAQVDYLVTELGRDYRGVDAKLRAPGVSLDQASDVVLLRFEIPAVVVNGKPGDPALEEALRRRRALGARALAAYRQGAP